MVKTDASGLRLDRATGLFDLGAGSGADLVQFDGEGFFHLAIGKEFYLIAATIEQARLAKGLLVDHGTRFEAAVEITDVDGADNITEIEVIESALWKTTVKRHLATFESDAGTATGTSFLAFVAFTRCFAVTGAFAAAKAFHLALCAWIRAVIVKLHDNEK